MRSIALRPSRAFSAAVIVFACLIGLPRAGWSHESAAAFIQNLGAQTIQLPGQRVPAAQRVAALRQTFASDFDIADASQFFPGPAGRAFSPEQRQEFQALFADYLAKDCMEKLGRYGGEPFRVTGSRPIDDEMLVTSEIETHGGKPLGIDWHVLDRDGRFLISDVYIDGVSMKQAHRSEFTGIIRRNGGRPEALFAALRQDLAMTPSTEVGSGSSLPPHSAPPPAYGH